MVGVKEAQCRIDEIQSLYHEWLRLLPELEAVQDEWREAAEIVRRLDRFYSRGYNRYYTEIENRLPISLETEGEYNIMNQDTLYDALGSHYRLSWEWIRLAVASLDPDKRSGWVGFTTGLTVFGRPWLLLRAGRFHYNGLVYLCERTL